MYEVFLSQLAVSYQRVDKCGSVFGGLSIRRHAVVYMRGQRVMGANRSAGNATMAYSSRETGKSHVRLRAAASLGAPRR